MNILMFCAICIVLIGHIIILAINVKHLCTFISLRSVSTDLLGENNKTAIKAKSGIKSNLILLVFNLLMVNVLSILLGLIILT
jgi:hypothetical protein